MALQGTWEADKMLDLYIYDFLKKRNLEESAKAFLTESNLSADRVAIDAPGGFLLEWWSVFWDVFMVRTGQKHSEMAASYVETQQIKAREQQQQLQLQLHLQRQQRQRMQNHLQGMPTGLNGLNNSPGLQMRGSDALLRQPTTMSPDVLAAKKNIARQRDTIGNSFISGPLMHTGAIANAVGVTNDVSAMQSVMATHPSPSIFGVPIPASIDQKASLLDNSGMLLNDAAGDASLMQPLKGWPIAAQAGMRRQQMMSNVNQSSKAFGQSPGPQYNQMQQPLTSGQMQIQQQLYLNQNQSFPQAQRMLSRNGLISNGRDVMQTNGGSDFSQGAVSSPSMSQGNSQDNRKMYMKVAQMQQQQQSGAFPQQFQRQQQDRLSGIGSNSQNGRKRKSEPTSSSGPANSSGTVNTTDTTNLSPNSGHGSDPQSVGLSIAQQQLQSQLAITSPFGSGDDGNTSDPLADPYQILPPLHEVSKDLSPPTGTSAPEVNATPRFSFTEVGCLRASTSKVLCCHFSSDGNLLASAGHDKKVNLWNVPSLKLEHTLEEHLLLITDVRFSPTSTRLATSSFDKTVRVWEVRNPAYSLRTFQGHATSVMSLDFHPNNEDLLCSCDGDSEIRYWSVSQGVCIKNFKGGVTQVRFQPRIGRFLAAAAESVVSVFDVETESNVHCLLNHNKPVHSLCWSASGDFLATLTEDYVRVWAIGSSNIEGAERSTCIHELGCNGKKFHSCVFHPNYPSLLVIGCYQSMELWNMVENKSMTVAAHEGLIASLVSSPTTGLVASASHDKCVKLWQ